METKKASNGKRLFTADQKKQIVEEMSSLSAAEVSRKYSVNVGMLYKWRQALEDGQNTAFRSGEAPVAASELRKAKEEIKRLQRALGKKTMECDILE